MNAQRMLSTSETKIPGRERLLTMPSEKNVVLIFVSPGSFPPADYSVQFSGQNAPFDLTRSESKVIWVEQGSSFDGIALTEHIRLNYNADIDCKVKEKVCKLAQQVQLPAANSGNAVLAPCHGIKVLLVFLIDSEIAFANRIQTALASFSNAFSNESGNIIEIVRYGSDEGWKLTLFLEVFL